MVANGHSFSPSLLMLEDVINIVIIASQRSNLNVLGVYYALKDQI